MGLAYATSREDAVGARRGRELACEGKRCLAWTGPTFSFEEIHTHTHTPHTHTYNTPYTPGTTSLGRLLPRPGNSAGKSAHHRTEIHRWQPRGARIFSHPLQSHLSQISSEGRGGDVDGSCLVRADFELASRTHPHQPPARPREAVNFNQFAEMKPVRVT
ncbi:hypothetical protein GGTG_02600 [Gaeumannomyces tritici R3-111a-1]|uniref:Uncharacterized protein n=1 Tax=Gaeumannomyces tritici (strain R3-111a-1) TaxID=644352 RepID=J3NMU1_GAET3|nr:hypothetical protein GGTG_02600 [Gaeumannomyces tritici R3-111a-1]EJT77492.1 hypothetical protein GGTG_02600 [Gaeumannomyces tritici R3-111a-1]